MLQLRQKNELIFQRICPPSTSHAGNTVLCSNHTQKKERQTWSFPFFTAGKMNQDLLFSLCCSDLWISTFQPPSLRPWPVFQTVSGEVSELLGISLSLSAIATSKAAKVHFFFWRGIAHTKRHIKCLLREVTLCQVGESFFFSLFYEESFTPPGRQFCLELFTLFACEWRWKVLGIQLYSTQNGARPAGEMKILMV